MKTYNVKELKNEINDLNFAFKYAREKIDDAKCDKEMAEEFVSQLMHERELLVNAADRLMTFLPENHQAKREYIRLKELLKYKN